MKVSHRFLLTLCAFLVLPSISACNWVDSAGGEADPVALDPVGPIPVLEAFQDDVPLDDMPVGNVIVFQEGADAQIRFTEDSGDFDDLIFNWISLPVEQGKLPACADRDGFFSDYAASSLATACLDAEECEINFERVGDESDEESNGAEFRFTVPVLKASVGLLYQLEIEDASGEATRTDYNICLIAINEGPIANADEFVVTDGSRLSVTSTDINLLSNDSDDEDARNEELRVATEPAMPPASATFFELGSDGSFIYQANFSSLRDERSDAFEYTVSDGVSSSVGRVTIRIVPINLAPVLIDSIPPISIVEGEPIEVDLAQYFSDPEGGSISFSFSEISVLPPSGRLTLSAQGVFSGTPLAVDAGSYTLVLQAYDGTLTTEATLILEIVPAPLVAANSAPVFTAGSVGSRVALVNRAIPEISPQFTDPDGDELTFSMEVPASLPRGVTIDSETGVISGTPLFRQQANNLRVRATDDSGASALSTLFFIRVL